MTALDQKAPDVAGAIGPQPDAAATGCGDGPDSNPDHKIPEQPGPTPRKPEVEILDPGENPPSHFQTLRDSDDSDLHLVLCDIIERLRGLSEELSLRGRSEYGSSAHLAVAALRTCSELSGLLVTYRQFGDYRQECQEQSKLLVNEVIWRSFTEFEYHARAAARPPRHLMLVHAKRAVDFLKPIVDSAEIICRNLKQAQRRRAKQIAEKSRLRRLKPRRTPKSPVHSTVLH